MCLTTKLSTEDTEDGVGEDCLYSSGWIASIRRVDCLDSSGELPLFVKWIDPIQRMNGLLRVDYCSFFSRRRASLASGYISKAFS